MTNPYVSVIIPTFERPTSLQSCVGAVRDQNYPRNRFEVIVVDDGSATRIEDCVQNLFKDDRITFLRQANAGPAAARNMGAQHAQGDVLVFTDDDCLPGKTWLRELIEPLRKDTTILVGGRVINGLTGNLFSTTSQLIISEAYSYFLSRNSELRFFASNNMAISRKLFHQIGGFDSSFRTSEDREFCDRLIHKGYSLVYRPEAIVRHYHDLELATFFRQHFSYGRGAYQYHRVRALRSDTQLRPETGYYLSVFRRAFDSRLSRRPFSVAALLGLWQIATISGFMWERISRKSRFQK